jgi:hypothetical protein
MPEVAVKMRMAPNTSNTTMSGTSHHFFSCLQKPKNSFNKAHMLLGIVNTGWNAVEPGIFLGAFVESSSKHSFSRNSFKMPLDDSGYFDHYISVTDISMRMVVLYEQIRSQP